MFKNLYIFGFFADFVGLDDEISFRLTEVKASVYERLNCIAWEISVILQ